MPSVSPTPAGAAVASTAFIAGRAVAAARPLAAGGAVRVGVVAGGVAAAALWATAYGCHSIVSYRKGRISKGKAIKTTTAVSIGIGVATSAGILAANAARASALVLTASAIVPFLVGTAVAGSAKAAFEWNRKKSK